ncbi:phytanoyl-CoA dioxygenase [Pseudotenacibaculum sp. MALMAid0570]|uniref:phytanoyl-CoA dioxygenase n=1 Tax=Pseudotenacibaculum sp. MALMAid0570 TaxID=3143938 RepID=UPI0032DEA115
METTTPTVELKNLSQKLLNADVNNNEELLSILNEMYQIYQELTGINGKDEDLEHLACLPAETGVALSLNHAAACFLDYRRTTKFLKGFVQAIKDKQKKHPNETIKIFYAGCGPFAPFVTLIAPMFGKDEVQFSVLEINEKSLKIAKKLIRQLGLTDYVNEYYQADAIKFEIPNADEYHILFSETLDALLNRECYVPILWNLLPQLRKDITVVPENVVIKLNFKKGSEEVYESDVFDVRKVLRETEKTKELPQKFAQTSVSLSDAEKYDSVILDTAVFVYKEHFLERCESSLSMALEIPIHKPITHKAVEFIYSLKPEPALQLEMRE